MTEQFLTNASTIFLDLIKYVAPISLVIAIALKLAKIVIKAMTGGF